jgi:3-isopropylmalate/(R)-2-methylmalate dehydratase large subunit
MKALARASGLPFASEGQIVDVRPDLVLSHDNTAAIAELFDSLGCDRIAIPDRIAVTLDHAVPAPSATHSQNHAEVRQFVARHGIRHFFEAGRGICHQVLSEETLILPGQSILGADSHTTHFGWLGAFGAGIGRSEVAALWATGKLWLRVPETIRIELVGAPRRGLTAKDVGLWILQLLGSEAGIYRALEFGGPGLRRLSVEGRMVLPNLMAESGAKSAWLEPDELVFAWLAQRVGRRAGIPARLAEEQIAAGALFPDPDAPYSVRHTLDLGQLEPAVSLPHRPERVAPLREAVGVTVNQAFIGTCTNGRLEDLAEAAAVLRGPGGKVRRVAPGTRLLVIPASSEVLADAISLGYVHTFVEAGAMIGVPGCGPCMGNHMGIPASGETVISSANRNFRGRMGNSESDIYLASPAVVAASAVLGRIAAPWEVTGDSGEEAPDAYRRVNPAPAGSHFPALGLSASRARHSASDVSTEASLSRARQSPANRQIPATPFGTGPATGGHVLSGRAWVYGDDVNTDQIFPGKYTYTVRDPFEMARHALEDLDASFASSVGAGDIIVAGSNWGCGSSREQAVTCLRAAGVRVIIAASFARIYFRNAVNNGLLPLVCPEAAEHVTSGDTVTVDMDRHVVSSNGRSWYFPPLSATVQQIMDAGGLLEMIKCSRSA